MAALQQEIKKLTKALWVKSQKYNGKCFFRPQTGNANLISRFFLSPKNYSGKRRHLLLETDRGLGKHDKKFLYSRSEDPSTSNGERK